ncbi:cytochrome c oxidase assembly protein [Salinibacterium sp. dk2585]|uniref:cytochrome c oxidase assembly protein n=1 Tax=unclassified Salinibacterium TaxID=2632331 RepID=UPI0011C24AB5|nr:MULTISPECIES: cytochrome c oxidase assembly protein [unclassified Salinibacterium]QEE62070.1 cytochrome c oxidase assembly protein [Salinibacterium sp. dk2585]TXK53422.1 cytochrome c oxidase assembly protein [Salinibacterium sp. dk5596]
MHEHAAPAASAFPWLATAPLVLAGIVYLAAASAERRRGTRVWPVHRTVCWTLGLVVAASAFLGPLADRAHQDFVAHMAAHTLIGMVAPTLLVLGAPVTLALRTLDPVVARRLTRLLRSWPARIISHPVSAALLNVGSLWVLYLTPLHEAMMGNALLHYAVLVHFLLAGTLFAASILAIDPNPHKASRPVRAVVLLLSTAAHATLAKVLYAYPPAGIPLDEARAGAELMYYAGDAAELALILLFCLAWYRAAKPGRDLHNSGGRSTERPLWRTASAPEL